MNKITGVAPESVIISVNGKKEIVLLISRVNVLLIHCDQVSHTSHFSASAESSAESSAAQPYVV